MWKVYFKFRKDKNGITSFYLIPTVDYYRDRYMEDDGDDCSFDITFRWLFWTLTFTRYWGTLYQRKNKIEGE